MTFGRLLLRNLLYHWRGNCAVFLGVAVGTAVLTGALLVGDSLRGSLRDQTLHRLGWVDRVMVSGRLVREGLADKLDATRVCPALLLQGSAGTVADEAPPPFGISPRSMRRVSKVTILGVDERFWPSDEEANAAFWQSDDADRTGVVLNATLARAGRGAGTTNHLASAEEQHGAAREPARPARQRRSPGETAAHGAGHPPG